MRRLNESVGRGERTVYYCMRFIEGVLSRTWIVLYGSSSSELPIISFSWPRCVDSVNAEQ